MTDTRISTRLTAQERPSTEVALDDVTLRRLDFEVTGPTIDTNRMDVTLCTSTTCSSSGNLPKK